VVAEWLNATDCNFVPISVRRFKSFSPQQRKKPRMTQVTQDRVKQRRKAKPSQGLGEGRRKTRSKLRRKQGKGNLPQYVRGVPRRPNRSVEKALRKVYGVGRVQARAVSRACGRRPGVRVGNLEGDQVQLREGWRMENLLCSSDRRRVEAEAINRHLKLGTVRGMNLRRGLPVRGQRTSTNGMTARALNKQRGTKVRE
jgi:small subunit ribosomal protein S13